MKWCLDKCKARYLYKYLVVLRPFVADADKMIIFSQFVAVRGSNIQCMNVIILFRYD